MKLAIFSDIHTEFGGMLPKLDPDSYDYVILAGDILTNCRKIEYMARSYKKIIYVLGNHEYWGHSKFSHEKVMNLYKNEVSKFNNITLLDKEYIELDNHIIYGATFWTNFSSTIFKDIAILNAKTEMNDFNNYVSPHWVLEEHDRAVNNLKELINKVTNKKIIVVSHHAPSVRSISEQYKDDWTICYYYSNLDYLLDEVDLWVHGHVHNSSDYETYKARVVCNPHGYIGVALNPNFDKSKIIEI